MNQAFDLRKEEDVKDYLDNLGVEYRYQCEKEKDPEGCHRLADFYEAFRQDEKRAAGLYLKNCDENNYGNSCHKIAAYHMSSRGGCEKDYSISYKYYTKGCDAGFATSCYNAGLMHDVGYLKQANLDKDFGKSAEFLRKGCELGSAPSCNLLSTYFLQGRKGVAKDMKKAFDYASKACDMNHMYSCANVSIMYKKGDGVERNVELSKKYEQRAKQLYNDNTVPENTIKMNQ